MFGSEILDVAIGLILVFLLLSLLTSAVREALESITKSRATGLAQGIRELLDDAGLYASLYNHPLVFSLYRGSLEGAEQRKVIGVLPSSGLPSYIPSRNFALALMDTMVRGAIDNPYALQQTGQALSVDNLRAALARVRSPRVQRSLLLALDTANGDLVVAQQNIEAWYDSAMDRVSGWYKRRTQGYLFLIGLVVTVIVNVNTITIANHLAHNKAAREALVARAEAVARDSVLRSALARDSARRGGDVRQSYQDIASLDLPLGWTGDVPRPGNGRPRGNFWNDWVLPILGLLITAFAITFGAPFWFDMLNKVMVIRSTVKPHEKSPEEASEDRQPPPAPVIAPGAGGAGGLRAPPTVVQPVATTAAVGAGAVVVHVAPPFEPREWADGQPDGGII